MHRIRLAAAALAMVAVGVLFVAQPASAATRPGTTDISSRLAPHSTLEGWYQSWCNHMWQSPFAWCDWYQQHYHP